MCTQQFACMALASISKLVKKWDAQKPKISTSKHNFHFFAIAYIFIFTHQRLPKRAMVSHPSNFRSKLLQIVNPLILRRAFMRESHCGALNPLTIRQWVFFYFFFFPFTNFTKFISNCFTALVVEGASKHVRSFTCSRITTTVDEKNFSLGYNISIQNVPGYPLR